MLENVKGTFGNKPTDKWRPFTYEERCAAAQKVAHFKEQFSNSTLSQSTIRSLITTFISSIKCRQEFPPPLGRFVDKVHIESLHIKNNAWQQWQKGLLKLPISKSSIGESTNRFQDIQPDQPFARYVNTLQYEVKAQCLARKI